MAWHVILQTAVNIQLPGSSSVRNDPFWG